MLSILVLSISILSVSILSVSILSISILSTSILSNSILSTQACVNFNFVNFNFVNFNFGNYNLDNFNFGNFGNFGNSTNNLLLLFWANWYKNECIQQNINCILVILYLEEFVSKCHKGWFSCMCILGRCGQLQSQAGFQFHPFHFCLTYKKKKIRIHTFTNSSIMSFWPVIKCQKWCQILGRICYDFLTFCFYCSKSYWSKKTNLFSVLRRWKKNHNKYSTVFLIFDAPSKWHNSQLNRLGLQRLS